MSDKCGKAIVTFDIDSGKVLSVKDEKGKEAKVTSLKETELNGRHVTYIPDHTVILTHSSPGCFVYVFNGKLYTICI